MIDRQHQYFFSYRSGEFGDGTTFIFRTSGGGGTQSWTLCSDALFPPVGVPARMTMFSKKCVEVREFSSSTGDLVVEGQYRITAFLQSSTSTISGICSVQYCSL